MLSPTAAIVNIYVADNGTVQDAFQFGVPGDTSWTLAPNFKMEVKASRDDPTPLATWSTGGGTIVIDDAVQRVIHLNVPESVLQAALPVAEYVYDLVMYDNSVPPVRTPLMQGKFIVSRGVTED